MNLRAFGWCLLLVVVGCGGSASKNTDAGGDGAVAGTGGGAGTGAAAGTDGVAGTGAAAGTGGGAAGADGGAGSAADAQAQPDGATEVGGDAGAEVAPPTPASGTPYRALAVTTGVTDACVLLDNHRVKCWGADAYGSLGSGSDLPRGEPADMGNALPFVDLGAGRTATAIASGRYHTCAILDDGDVKCWGLRTMTGQPLVAGDVGIGDEPGEMGDALPTLNLGGHKAKQVACGYFLSCALVDDGGVWCWGDGKPQPASVGLPATWKVKQLAGTSGVVALLEDGSVVNVSSQASALALTGTKKAAFVAGAMGRVCGVLEDHSLACSPELGTPATPLDLAAVSVGMNTPICGLSLQGDVRCWGTNSCSSYPVGSIYWCPAAIRADNSFAVALGQKAVSVSSGGLGHACALLADGGVKCWTTYDQCPNSAGGADACAVPPKPTYVLGGSIDVTGSGASRKWGTWRKIDFGSYP